MSLFQNYNPVGTLFFSHFAIVSAGRIKKVKMLLFCATVKSLIIMVVPLDNYTNVYTIM
jgi:hypothetical protein